MLPDQSAATVRTTLPAGGGTSRASGFERGGAALGEITERFYARLFASHPGLRRSGRAWLPPTSTTRCSGRTSG
ncbi:hypothetical protein ACWD5V_00205 [Streptomyces sp. NPDC002523]